MNFTKLSLQRKAEFRYIYAGNTYLKQGQFQKANDCYRQAAKVILKIHRNWPDNSSPEKQFIINHEYYFVYCPIPKVACSSFKKFIFLLSDVENKEEILNTPGELHKYMQEKFSLSNYSREKVKQIIKSPKYFKFAIVRNPWSRLVSAYVSKFVKFENKPFVQNVIETIYTRNGMEPNYINSITFRQFLEYINMTDDKFLDHHWKPQYLLLGSTTFDFIGKFENISEDFEYIQEKLNINIKLPWHNKSNYSQTSASILHTQNYADYNVCELKELNKIPTYQDFYTEDLIELVRQRYKIDINMFDYDFEAKSK